MPDGGPAKIFTRMESEAIIRSSETSQLGREGINQDCFDWRTVNRPLVFV